MSANKTLTSIVLAGALALFGAGCGSKSSETPASGNASTAQTKMQYDIKKVYGRIVSIDEDSFAMGAFYKGANFEFEHFRIEATDGKTYKLIFPGPSNYQVGDTVHFQYKAQPRISYQDLLNVGTAKNKDDKGWLLQDGFFEADGLIQR